MAFGFAFFAWYVRLRVRVCASACLCVCVSVCEIVCACVRALSSQPHVDVFLSCTAHEQHLGTVDEFEHRKDVELKKRMEALPEALRRVCTGETRQFDFKAEEDSGARLQNPLFGKLEPSAREALLRDAGNDLVHTESKSLDADHKQFLKELKELEQSDEALGRSICDCRPPLAKANTWPLPKVCVAEPAFPVRYNSVPAFTNVWRAAVFNPGTTDPPRAQGAERAVHGAANVASAETTITVTSFAAALFCCFVVQQSALGGKQALLQRLMALPEVADEWDAYKGCKPLPVIAVSGAGAGAGATAGVGAPAKPAGRRGRAAASTPNVTPPSWESQRCSCADAGVDCHPFCGCASEGCCGNPLGMQTFDAVRCCCEAVCARVVCVASLMFSPVLRFQADVAKHRKAVLLRLQKSMARPVRSRRKR